MELLVGLALEDLVNEFDSFFLLCFFLNGRNALGVFRKGLVLGGLLGLVGAVLRSTEVGFRFGIRSVGASSV